MNNQNRFKNIDMLRGFIMLLMAIDHCYLIFYQIHYAESWNSPLPNYGSTAVFFTRWVSNICAPGFALLMGMSMTISFLKKFNELDRQSCIHFFIKRGIVLIILQQVLDLPSLLFNINNLNKLHLFRGGILYALGVSLIIGSIFIRFKSNMQILIGTIIVLINYFITSIILKEASNSTILNLLFIPGVNKWSNINYAAIPWLGITIIGMGLGGFYIKDFNKTSINLFKIGIGFLLFFIFLRFINYGDYNHIINFSNIINYLAVIKYPPSIAFVILTMGLLLLLFWVINKLEAYAIMKSLLVFGQAPLFFYFAHYYLFIILSKFSNHTIPLATMYLYWILDLIIVFPICKYYIKFKSKQSKSSFWSYL